MILSKTIYVIDFLNFPPLTLYARPPIHFIYISPLHEHYIYFVLLHDSTFSHILVCMIAFQHQDQNVYRIQSVQIISHASKRNARIHVLLTPVDRMPNARLKIIEHSVFVSMVMQEILTLCVKNVRLNLCPYVLTKKISFSQIVFQEAKVTFL